MARDLTLKLIEDEKTYYPVNWSFLFRGDSRVYDEAKDIKGIERIEGFDPDNKHHLACIEDETERLSNMGIIVAVVAIADIKL